MNIDAYNYADTGVGADTGAGAFLPKILVCLPLLCLLLLPLPAESFRFRYREGERYRILSEVEQDVYINGEYSYSAELLNRIQVEVLELRGLSAREQVYYQHSEEAEQGSGDAYHFAQEYSANFWISEYGYYDIESQYFVPSVRDVPVFPERDLSPGDTWSATGQEVHDFRESFGLENVYSFSIPVSYRYVGPVRKDGIDLHHIKIDYTVSHLRDSLDRWEPYPYRIRGSSDQNLYFDNVLGRPHSYEENYEFILDLTDGVVLSYSGKARAWVIESEKLDREAIQKDIRKKLDDLGVEDSSVISDERGVTISLENIQFLPDSALLRASEKRKLDKIAEIIAEYAERDILVSGHSALAGSVRGQQLLSEERAGAVVDYLLEIGARERAHILYQGFGAERPLASNSSEAGKRRNRRVEITILEN